MSGLLVTYRRRRSGRTHQIRFECGADNRDLALREAWNTGSDIVTVDDDDAQEPQVDDAVLCCPYCDRPNQFGEVCASCERDRQDEIEEAYR